MLNRRKFEVGKGQVIVRSFLVMIGQLVLLLVILLFIGTAGMKMLGYMFNIDARSLQEGMSALISAAEVVGGNFTGILMVPPSPNNASYIDLRAWSRALKDECESVEEIPVDSYAVWVYSTAGGVQAPCPGVSPVWKKGKPTFGLGQSSPKAKIPVPSPLAFAHLPAYTLLKFERKDPFPSIMVALDEQKPTDVFVTKENDELNLYVAIRAEKGEEE